MRVSAGNSTAVLRCNTANSSATIDGKKENIYKRIGSVRNLKFPTFNPALHLHKPLGAIEKTGLLKQPRLQDF